MINKSRSVLARCEGKKLGVEFGKVSLLGQRRNFVGTQGILEVVGSG